MADPPRFRDAGDGTGVEPDRGSPPGAPRWVKVSAIVVGILILLVVIVKLTGVGGSHGPGRHTGSSGTPFVSVTDLRVTSGANPTNQQARQVSYR